MIKELDNHILNCSVDTIYSYNGHSTQELLSEQEAKINEMVRGLNGKTDLYGDHKGSWQGISKPVFAEPGLAGVVDNLVENEIPRLENKIDTNKEDVDLFKEDINNVVNDLDNSKYDKTGGVVTGNIETGSSLLLKGWAEGKAVIKKNNTFGRDELQLYANEKAYSTGSRGAGIHLYGNDDDPIDKHPGMISFLTGENDKGNVRMMLDQRGRLVLGDGIIDYTDKGENPALVTLKNPVNTPALYITECGEQEGEIAVGDTDIFRLGGWSEDRPVGTKFEQWLRVSKNVIRFKDKNIMVAEKNIQCGKASVVTVEADTIASITVDFPVPFEKTPIVTVTPVTSSPGNTVKHVGVDTVTPTGFKLYVVRGTVATSSIMWTAISQ